MGPFEVTFSLFGLLLAMSLAQILGGFAKATKRVGHTTGFLTPLLCLFLLYDIATFWISAWAIRELLPIQIGTLVVGLVITGFYYFAAVLVWPDDGDPAWEDLDGWMLRQKRKVFISMAAANAANLAGAWFLVPGGLGFGNIQYALIACYFLGLFAGAFAFGKKQTLLVLIVLIALYAGDLYVNVIGTGKG
jgi:hypothetical protein